MHFEKNFYFSIGLGYILLIHLDPSVSTLLWKYNKNPYAAILFIYILTRILYTF